MTDRSRAGLGVPAGLAVAKFAIHLAVLVWGGYGYFRDELYYLACASHPSFGYVDQPPLSIWLLALWRSGFGDSLFALRLLPALAGAATVFMTGRIARTLGGGPFAQAVASLAALVALIQLGMSGYYSMNAFDFLFWAVAVDLFLGALAGKSGARWLVLGAVLGLGLLNKVGVVWLGAGMAVGLLATTHRRWYRTRWPWMAGAVAALIFFPYVAWNAVHGFPHLEFMRNAMLGKYAGLNPASFLTGQVLIQNPVTLPVWAGGLWFLVATRSGRAHQILVFVFLTALAILLAAGHSKAEYLAPAYVIPFAAGGVAWERWLTFPVLGWLRIVGLAGLVSGLALTPIAIPVLPVETFIRYQAALGLAPTTSEEKELAELPQFYADMFGWEEKAMAAATVFRSLPAEERERCAIYAENYGRCGAIDHYGKALGLPAAIGNHNNYWLWGPRQYTGEVMIILGGGYENKARHFESVVVADTVLCRYCMPYEDDMRIYVCRGLRRLLAEMWPDLKHFD